MAKKKAKKLENLDLIYVKPKLDNDGNYMTAEFDFGFILELRVNYTLTINFTARDQVEKLVADMLKEADKLWPVE